MLELVEQPLRDVVVGSFPVPHAALVAAAKMDTESDVVKPLQNSVVRLERAAEVLFRLLAPVPHRLQRWRVDVSRVSRRIDLNVTTTRLDEPANHFSLHADDIVHEVVHTWIHGSRILPVEPLRDSIRPNESHFRGLFCFSADKAILLQGRIAHQPQSFDNRSSL